MNTSRDANRVTYVSARSLQTFWSTVGSPCAGGAYCYVSNHSTSPGTAASVPAVSDDYTQRLTFGDDAYRYEVNAAIPLVRYKPCWETNGRANPSSSSSCQT